MRTATAAYGFLSWLQVGDAPSMPRKLKPDSSLCLECGICCDGTLFSGVQLRSNDPALLLRRLGLPLRKRGVSFRFSQPCAALCGQSCTLYQDRPSYCREFDCAVLKRVGSERLTRRKALVLIRKARRLATAVLDRLRKLGETDEKAPIKLRFARISRAIEIHPQSYDRNALSLFGEASTGLHQLHLLLAKEFFPGPQ